MKWYRRFADVPKVGYPGSPGVDRTKFPGHNSVPKIEVFRFDGERHESMIWPLPNGSTSASPAATWQTSIRPGETSAQTALRRLLEALELPGTLSDYHFAIQSCCDQLWNQDTRRAEAWVYPVIENLCWLDIHLVEAFPDVVRAENAAGPLFYRVTGFWTLIFLYRQEGYLYEAYDVAKRATKFDQHQKEFEELKERIAQLEAEGGR